MAFKEGKSAPRPALRRGALIVIALVLGAAWGGGPVPTGGPAYLIGVKVAKCVRLGKSGGRETLINRCGDCRTVKLQRRRPGGDFPAVRTIKVPELSRIELSFRGPGRTRIVSDQSCRGGGGPASGGRRPALHPAQGHEKRRPGAGQPMRHLPHISRGTRPAGRRSQDADRGRGCPRRRSHCGPGPGPGADGKILPLRAFFMSYGMRA